MLDAAVVNADGVPDLAIGRLVETTDEIIGTIATFISQDGILDLTDPAETNKVLITGYAFLIDSGQSATAAASIAGAAGLALLTQGCATLDAGVTP